MARLRKASETPAMLPTATMNSTRSSPRKAAMDSPTKRELRYTWQDAEDSILIPKIPASIADQSETPRRQRVLKPVASNSRLLKRPSTESLASLATPELKGRGRRGFDEREGLGEKRGSLYARSLARTVARSRAKSKDVREEKRRIEVKVDETVLGEDEEPDQSLWCGEQDEEQEEEAENIAEPIIKIHEDSDDEDEDPVVNARGRRGVARNRVIEELDSESESDLFFESQEKADDSKENLPQRIKPEPADGMPAPPRPPPFRKGHSAISNWAQDVVDLTSSPEAPASFVIAPPTRSTSLSSSSRPTSSSSNDVDAVLHFSPTPTKNRSPRKAPPISRPNTPPQPPSPSKLVSPSKKKPRIPTAPSLRPSLDAFWNPEVVNNWNDKHSPSKPLVSPKKQKWLQALEQGAHSSNLVTIDSDSDSSFASPTTSPRKKAVQSPFKKPAPVADLPVSQVRAQRKAFSTQKHTLAEAFLTKLDTTITSGEIARLTTSTGGIKLLWSKTLKTTAGRANWRREQIRTRTGPNPTDIKTAIHHHCSIELAEKVIDDEERLYNVLAHEYCHLTTFMISNVRNNPHGAEFKSWARKVSDAFADVGVEVTTKHSYEIAYKYVWECVGCGYEFKRHSKSVDPKRHSCGKCKGRLVQTKPTPRGAAAAKDGGAIKEKSEYQIFVKENFKRVKAELEAQGKDAQMGKVMEVVAREYRAWKEKKAAKETGELELALGGLSLGN